MHLAALFGNKVVMKLLIQYKFNLDKLINKKMKGDEYPNMTVFLLFCMNGNVECLSYLLQICNSVDFRARTQLGCNGLHLAVAYQHLNMVTFLLTNVYQKTKIRQKIFNQVGNSGHGNMSISQLAFKQINLGSSTAVSIGQTLMNHGCSFDRLVDHNAATTLSAVCIEKDFFQFFGLFKFLLSIYLKHDKISNLEEFFESSIITRGAVESILMKITDERHRTSVQYEWIYLITEMLISYTAGELAMKMSSNKQPSMVSTSDMVCTKNHKMIWHDLKSKIILCMHCRKRRDRFRFACCKCCEYICQRCAAKKLVEYLGEKKFDKFMLLARQYPSTHRIILDVCLSLILTVMDCFTPEFDCVKYNFC